MSNLTELLHLVARWVHLIAGIMWIGNSMLFNWLDRNLVMPDAPKEGLIGEIWMVHSGGFYQVEKKHLPAGQMPKTLHWFKWQNGITWLSGISLLILVYYMGGAALMTDPAVSRISPAKAVLLGISTIVGAWFVYDLIWRSSIGKRPTVAFALSVLTVLAGSWVQFHWLSGRAAYMHVGVMLGTIMTGNVWFVIIPSQRELVAATLAGREQDPAIGYQAKQRSIHNNYITFPLLFIMLSNHFPTTFGHALNWLVLLVLTLGSAAIRHLMNIRFTYRQWLFPATAVFFATCVATLFFFAHPEGFGRARRTTNGQAAVTWDDVQPIFQQRCQRCHSRYPTDTVFRVPPNGVVLDEYDDAVRWKERIKLRAVVLRNMPLANQTNITDAERARIGAWIDQGAKD
jgi:uncharacterized membrane protein